METLPSSSSDQDALTPRNVISLDSARRQKLLEDSLTPVNFEKFRRELNKQPSGEELAPVIPINGEQPEEKQELLINTFKVCLESLKESNDPNKALEQAEQALQDIYANFPEADREYLAAKLMFYLSENHGNITKLAVGYPGLLQLIGFAANLDVTSENPKHPLIGATRRHALAALSLLPGEYNFETGEYTPSS